MNVLEIPRPIRGEGGGNGCFDPEKPELESSPLLNTGGGGGGGGMTSGGDGGGLGMTGCDGGDEGGRILTALSPG